MDEVKYNSNKKKRSLFLDNLRGFTVVLMAIFHFSFDLNHFGFINIDILHAPFWYFFPRLIVFLFLFIAGLSLALLHGKKIQWAPFRKKIFILIFWALTISLATYYFFREHWIYFGTLHAIATVSFMTLPFLKHPRLALFFALILFIPSLIWDWTIPWIELPHSSWDYISPFPWLGASLLGVYAKTKGIHLIGIPLNPLTKSLNYLGRHSLLFYLLHQPILFTLLMLITKVIYS